MGHHRLGTLPRTRRWNEVVALVRHGAHADQVARATIAAAEAGLRRGPRDAGVLETLWLLTLLPRAARAAAYEGALRECNLPVPERPGLMALAAAFAEAVDRRMANNANRTDLGEMAQMAAVEALVGVLSERTRGLFDATAEDVRRELAGLATPKPFGLFAAEFFARYTFKSLDYFLSRALYHHVGPGRRFLTLARVEEFTDALRLHCREAARYVEGFAGQWASKAHRQRGGATREDAAALAHGATEKLLAELRLGAASDVR